MYAKTNPGTGRLSPRQKRVFAIVGTLVVLAVVGSSLWAAFGSDKYSGSGHGCVNVTVPNSTGGATLPYCGDAARSVFRAPFRPAPPRRPAVRRPGRARRPTRTDGGPWPGRRRG